jgi:hypothetical protein
VPQFLTADSNSSKKNDQNNSNNKEEEKLQERDEIPRAIREIQVVQVRKCCQLNERDKRYQTAIGKVQFANFSTGRKINC